MTIVWPDGTASSVWTERVLIGGASPATAELPGLLTSASTSSVTRPPALMCGRDLQQHAGIDVLRGRGHGVGRRAHRAPTKVCWLIGMRSPTLIVAFWLSSADRCGLEMTRVLP